MSEILRRLRDEPNWNPSFGPGGLSRQEAKVWHETCVLAADELEHMQKIIDRVALLRLDLESENIRLTKENADLRAKMKWLGRNFWRYVAELEAIPDKEKNHE